MTKDSKNRDKHGRYIVGKESKGGRRSVPQDVKLIRTSAQQENAKALYLYYLTDIEMINQFDKINHPTQLQKITMDKIKKKDLKWFSELSDRVMGKPRITADILTEAKKEYDLRLVTSEDLDVIEKIASQCLVDDEPA